MQIVVFVLDSSPSMNRPYPAGGSNTRLDVAKEAIQNMLFEIMSRHFNKANVIVCKTAATDHHFYRKASGEEVDEEEDDDDDEIPFPNVVELMPLTEKFPQPSIDLMKRVGQVQSTLTEEDSEMARGDVVDGIMVAVDALHNYTKGSKTADRKVVVFTDAEHDFIIDDWQNKQLILSMNNLNCRMEVIGLDFETSADFSPLPFAVPSNMDVKPEDNTGTPGNETIYSEKLDKERVLVRIAEETGGVVMAASTIQEVLEANKGLRSTKAIFYKFQFKIAPGLEIQAFHVLMCKKFDLPRMVKKVVVVDDDERPRLDRHGNVMLDEVKPTYDYVYATDTDQSTLELYSKEDTIRAYPYNTTNVPTNGDDEKGLLAALGLDDQPVRIEILGYMDRRHVPDHYMVGPPSLLSGQMSQKACSMIAAMAQALQQSNNVAICVFYKKRDKAGYLGGLFPLVEPQYPSVIHLVFMALPHSGDVQDLNKDIFPLEEFLYDSEPGEAELVDNMVDSLMLPDGVLTPGSVPNPLARAWHQTLRKRAVDPDADPVLWRNEQEVDPISTPPDILRRAQPIMASFRSAFPLKDLKKLAADAKEQKRRDQGKHKILNFEDHLDD